MNNTKHAIGTYTREQWDRNYPKVSRTYPREKNGQFARDYSRGAIYGMFLAMILLIVLVLIAVDQVKQSRQEMLDTRENVKEYTKKATQTILEATMGQIANIEKDRVDMNEKMFGMTQGSVDLTKNMAEQLQVAKKLKAIQ